MVRAETVTGAPSLKLAHAPVVQSAVNRLVVRPAAGGADRVPGIVYDKDPGPTEVGVNTTSGELKFGTPPGTNDKVLATYTVAKASALKVTVKLGVSAAEEYNVVSGDDLIANLTNPLAPSQLVTATKRDKPAELPAVVTATPLTGGANGAAGAVYDSGLTALLDVDAHLIVAAGQDQTFGD